jgi:hypothetical protein
MFTYSHQQLLPQNKRCRVAMSNPAGSSESTLRDYSDEQQSLTTYRKRGAGRISLSQRRFLECLRSLPQELLNMVFRYMFLNNHAPDILYKLGLLRMCRYTGMVEALRGSIDMYTTIRVGRRNRSKELLSGHWDTLGRLKNLTMTVHTQASGIRFYLKYDHNIHLWTHAGADLGLTKTFLQRPRQCGSSP